MKLVWFVFKLDLLFVVDVVGRQTFVLNAPTIFPQAALLHWPSVHFPANQVLSSSSVCSPNLDKRWHFEIILGVARLHEQLNLAAMGTGVRQLTLDLARERHLDVVRGATPCTSYW